MGNFDWLFVVFMVMVGAERMWETGLSRKAERGEKKQTWSLPLFYVVHIAVLVSVMLEYFVMRRTIVPWISMTGFVIWGAALVLRLAAIRALGRFWSLHVEIRAQHQLIREGPYRYIRHPAYAAIILEFISLPLVGNCYFSLLPVILLYFPILAARIIGEEKALVDKFGETYVNYQRTVGLLVPRLRSRSSP